MMKNLWFVSIVLCGACAGSTGPEGAQGTQGTQGSQGADGMPGVAGTAGVNGQRVIWKDANGTVIPNLVDLAGGLRLVDGNGVFWSFDAINEPVNRVSAFANADVYWANAGCTGSFYIRPLAQHISIQLYGVGVTVTRPDGVTSTAPATLSISSVTGCADVSQTISGLLPGSGHTIVTAPTVTATSPIHPELAN
jgi:hypothetical protein